MGVYTCYALLCFNRYPSTLEKGLNWLAILQQESVSWLNLLFFWL